MTEMPQKRKWPDDTAREWWRELQQDRAARARLRRADMDKILLEPRFFDLHRRLFPNERDVPARLKISARIALALAHIRQDEPKKFGRAIGAPEFGAEDLAPVKLLRFKSLMQAEAEDLLREIRRAIDIIGGQANVGDVANLLVFWGDKTRARLALDYFAAGDAAPELAQAD